MVPVVPLFSTEQSKGKILALSQELINPSDRKINVMDKIWDRNSFDVVCHWPLWRDEKKRMTKQNRQKWNANKRFR